MREVARIRRRVVGAEETARAQRAWWDAAAADYQSEHGEELGAARLQWCPEGLDEAACQLLGPVEGRDVLEVGCGAAQGARWLRTQGARAVGVDISEAQVRASRALDAETGQRVPAVVADGVALPFAAASFDVVCSAFGAVPFVADLAALHGQVARVLRPGGRWVFATTHPLRWGLPDDDSPAALTFTGSYFDRLPYVEEDEAGVAVYVEHHRTLGDHVRALTSAGFALLDLVEPEWPAGRSTSYGQWGPVRGALIPGTAIFVTVRT